MSSVSENRGVKIMIFCFSGTGNSRYIAKQIAETLQDQVIDLNGKIKEQDTSPIQTDENVIVVVPTYAWRIPRVVSDWIWKIKLTGAKRIWFVMDCGSEIGDTAKYNRRLAEKKKWQYMGTAQIVMPENYIAMFNAPQKSEAEKIIEKAGATIERIITYIKEGKSFWAPRNTIYDRIMSSFVNPIFYRFIVKAKAFHADERCTGCGQCVRKCPMNNIQPIDGTTIWSDACTHCMACICYCPAEAIEYGKKSVGKPRYHLD